MATTAGPGERTGRYKELDGLRGIAATGVVLYHVFSLSEEFIPPEQPLPFDLQPLSLGVHLFFMISGFVIFFTIRRSRNVLDFAISRFTRLYPPFWVALTITAIVGWLSPLPWLHASPVQFLGNLTMVPAVFGIKLLDGAYWTLYVEMFFYFLMAVLLATGIIRREQLVLTLATIWAAMAAAASGVYAWLGHPEGLLGAASSGLIIEYAPLFATGMLALTMRESGRFDPRVVVTVAAALLAGWWMQGTAHMLKIMVPIALFLVVTSVKRVPILTSRPLQFLGAVSYTWYLVHQNISYSIINAIAYRPLAWVVALGATLTLAWLLHVTVERHVSAGLKRWLRGRAFDTSRAQKP